MKIIKFGEKKKSRNCAIVCKLLNSRFSWRFQFLTSPKNTAAMFILAFVLLKFNFIFYKTLKKSNFK